MASLGSSYTCPSVFNSLVCMSFVRCVKRREPTDAGSVSNIMQKRSQSIALMLELRIDRPTTSAFLRSLWWYIAYARAQAADGNT